MFIDVKVLLILSCTILLAMLLIVLIMLLFNANKVLKKIHEIIDDNQENLNNTLDEIPKFVANVNDLVVTGQDVANGVKGTVDGVSTFVEEKTREVATYGGILGDIIQTALDVMSKLKK